MKIGNGIKVLRKKSGLSQTEFANSIGINQSYLSQIEGGKKNPSTDLLEKIANHFKTPLPILFWFCVDESDIKESKKLEAFKIVKPSIDALIKEFI